MRTATRCSCSTPDPTARLVTAARIPRRYDHCGLENFEIHDPVSRGGAQECGGVGRVVAGDQEWLTVRGRSGYRARRIWRWPSDAS